jgi:hypothetical protein
MPPFRRAAHESSRYRARAKVPSAQKSIAHRSLRSFAAHRPSGSEWSGLLGGASKTTLVLPLIPAAVSRAQKLREGAVNIDL